jgi:uracil permease
MAIREIIQVEQKVPILKGIPLSFQHLFAMFGASVLVPILFNSFAKTQVVDPSLVLLMNGIGTLIYILVTKGKAPAFLGSSFAFLAPTATILGASIASGGVGAAMGFAQVTGGFVVAGLAFVLVSLIIRFAGRKWISIVLPAAAMGPIVSLIGLNLAGVAAGMAFGPDFAKGSVDTMSTILSMFTLAVVVVGSMVFRKVWAAVPVLVGLVAGYVLALILNAVYPDAHIMSFASLGTAQLFAVPKMVFPSFDLSAILIILPAALVVMSEHIGHLFVTGNIVERNLIKDPGLHNSMLGDGLSTMLSGFTGSCPTTTYGENMGVMAITKVYSVWIIGGAAVISIIIAFFGHLSALISSIPGPVIGGLSLMLYGVIAASGLRMLVEAKVDYSKSRNLLLSAIVFVVGVSGLSIKIGTTDLSGMVLATLVGIFISLIFWIFDLLKWTAEPDESVDHLD